MNIHQNASVKELNTFQVDVKCKYLVEIENEADINDFIQLPVAAEKNIFILGGGSNVLFTKNFEGTLLHSKIGSIDIIQETDAFVDVSCGSGINWDSFVAYCVEKGWGGLENLSDIPGNVGACPVQNIGAYGVEAKDHIISVEAINLETGKKKVFSNKECSFEYRNSIFKKQNFRKYFITSVSFRLSRKHTLITHYGKVEEKLKKFSKPTIADLRQTIIDIRRSKLPTVDTLGSGGSFFKNPIVPLQVAEELKTMYPEIPSYPQKNGCIKLSSAWLIDKAGLKGLRQGDVAAYENQPLVIVNYGKASGKEISDFALFIQNSVFDKFGIRLEPEVIYL